MNETSTNNGPPKGPNGLTRATRRFVRVAAGLAFFLLLGAQYLGYLAEQPDILIYCLLAALALFSPEGVEAIIKQWTTKK